MKLSKRFSLVKYEAVSLMSAFYILLKRSYRRLKSLSSRVCKIFTQSQRRVVDSPNEEMAFPES